MPRLTNNDFLARHHFLAALWEDPLLRSMFSALEPMEQMHLHQYFQTINTDGDGAVIETRTTVNKGDRALPQQAGKAWGQLVGLYGSICSYYDIPTSGRADLIESFETMKRAATHSPEEFLKLVRPATPRPTHDLSPDSFSRSRRRDSKGHHSVQAIMNPEIDAEGFARALLTLAIHLKKEEAKTNGDDSDAEMFGKLLAQLGKGSSTKHR